MPAGGSVHWSGGETSAPVQPYFWGIDPPVVKAELVNSKGNGVAVGGMGVSVGTGVFVGGCGVAVGGMGVSVGEAGVSASEMDSDGVVDAPPHAIKSDITKIRQNT